MSSGFSCKVPEAVIKTCYEYEGVIMPNFMPIEALKGVRKLACRPDDLFIVTYPKSGTTWAELLTFLIRHDGDASKLEGTHITKIIPFLEIIDEFGTSPTNLRVDEAETMPSPRTFKTHCHDPFLPLDISNDNPKAKVLYIARNPKDTAVSYYHFCKYIELLPSYETWDEYFEEFFAGRAPQGSWFENVLPWWRRRNHPNVLFLKYEDMKKDLPCAVRQIAEFMGKSLSEDIIEKISKASTFSAMKKSKTSNPDSLIQQGRQPSKNSFMRKGVVGDWKNLFTEDQNRRFDELYEKEMTGSGLEFVFE